MPVVTQIHSVVDYIDQSKNTDLFFFIPFHSLSSCCFLSISLTQVSRNGKTAHKSFVNGFVVFDESQNHHIQAFSNANTYIFQVFYTSIENRKQNHFYRYLSQLYYKRTVNSMKRKNSLKSIVYYCDCSLVLLLIMVCE